MAGLLVGGTGSVDVAAATSGSPPTDPMPSNAQILSTVSDLVDIAPRVTGTRGGRQAASYVAGRFREAGLSDVHFEKATSYNWTPSGYGLSVGGSRIAAFPVSHSLIKGESTPGRTTLGPDGRTAPVVDIGPLPIGSADVSGKFVMFDVKFQLPLAALAAVMEFFWDPALELVNATTLLTANPYVTSLESTYVDAMAAGAVGVIAVLADYFDSNRYHNELYRGTAFKIPGMFVTKRVAAQIRSSLAPSTQATMKLTVVRKKVVARTVVGFLPGRTKETLMVQSHHDSQGPGAVEDGTGTAEVIALADYYGALARRPDYTSRAKTLMFITFDTHFTGYQSHIAFADKYLIKRRTPYRIVGNATIEHVGKKAVIGPGGRLRTLNQSEPRGIFENLNPLLKTQLAGILVDNDLRATALLNATPFLPVGIPTDASFAVLAGLPIVSLIAGPLYMYDEADTLDKVHVSQLRPVARAYQQIIDLMEQTPSDLIGLVPAPVLDSLPLPLLG